MRPAFFSYSLLVTTLFLFVTSTFGNILITDENQDFSTPNFLSLARRKSEALCKHNASSDNEARDKKDKQKTLIFIRDEYNMEAPYNNAVLEAIATMPVGGGYGISPTAMKHLRETVFLSNGHLILEPQYAEPSFCSEATYFVFLKTLNLLEHRGTLHLSPEVMTALQPGNKADGHGVWGRWNANGPGVARLFKTLGLGPNFTDLSTAQPGDFLKIFWSDAIGALEHGHLVIFLGQEKKSGIDYINFWSSNIPNGYGKKSVPLSRIHHMIFSRLTHPEAILNVSSLPETDLYLASLLYRSTTIEEGKLK